MRHHLAILRKTLLKSPREINNHAYLAAAVLYTSRYESNSRPGTQRDPDAGAREVDSYESLHVGPLLLVHACLTRNCVETSTSEDVFGKLYQFDQRPSRPHENIIDLRNCVLRGLGGSWLTKYCVYKHS